MLLTVGATVAPGSGSARNPSALPSLLRWVCIFGVLGTIVLVMYTCPTYEESQRSIKPRRRFEMAPLRPPPDFLIPPPPPFDNSDTSAGADHAITTEDSITAVGAKEGGAQRSVEDEASNNRDRSASVDEATVSLETKDEPDEMG